MREQAAFTRIELPAVRKREAGAFTLIELLVVIAIIALLVSILVPSLSRATALARKSACAAKLSGHGKAVAIFVAENDSYPIFGPWTAPGQFKILDYPSPGLTDDEHIKAWPKTYGVLEAMGIQGTHKTNLDWWAYFWEADDIWEGVLCDAMDAPAILQWCDGATFGPLSPMWKIAYHPAAIGYQWNFRLRGANPNGIRWTARLDPRGEPLTPGGPFLCQNMDWAIFLPNNPTEYAAQAVAPEEVVKPSECAEAWDSPDFETLDWISQSRDWHVEALMPGFFAGPQMEGTKGWALLPGSRHPKSPNILYVNGSVRADATRKIKPEQDLGTCPSGDWTGLNVKSWSDFSMTFGTIHHILPDARLPAP